jgi:hypothetical protein
VISAGVPCGWFAADSGDGRDAAPVIRVLVPVVAPVVGRLTPLVQPLAPIIEPVTQAVEPVLAPVNTVVPQRIVPSARANVTTKATPVTAVTPAAQPDLITAPTNPVAVHVVPAVRGKSLSHQEVSASADSKGVAMTDPGGAPGAPWLPTVRRSVARSVPQRQVPVVRRAPAMRCPQAVRFLSISGVS